MCNENDKINMSEWTLDRIQAEQDKHMSFMSTGVIPTVDVQQIEHNLDPIGNALDAYIHKVTEDTDMYIICEIAKLYIESQRPAEWEDSMPESVDCIGEGVKVNWYECSNPYCRMNSTRRTPYCPYCGRRMKNGN